MALGARAFEASDEKLTERERKIATAKDALTAVIAASAPLSGLLSRNFSIKGAPSPIQRKHGTKVHQLASNPPRSATER